MDKKTLPDHELPQNDSQKEMDSADQNRRGFLKKAGAIAVLTAAGIEMPFGDKMPEGYRPLALADTGKAHSITEKHPDMRVLNDKPLNMETPAHLLDDEVTPADKMFVRNNGIPPENLNSDTWTLTIDNNRCSSHRNLL